MTTDLDRFELARQRLAAPKPVDVPLAAILAELPRDVLHEITSKPINGVSYRVRIDTKLEVYVDHDDQWNRCGRLDCTPGADSLQLIADHFAGQLAKTRRSERTWRGEVTPERIARDFDEATKADEERTARKAQVAKVLARKAAEVQS